MTSAAPAADPAAPTADPAADPDATPPGAPRATNSPGAFLAWMGFAALLFYAILIGGGWLGLYVGWTRLFDLVIVAVGLVTWLILAWRRPAWRPTSAIWPAFLVALVSMGLSLAFSPFPRLGLDYLAWAVLLVALYLLLVRILALPFVQARIGGLLAAIAFVIGLAYVLWTVALWMEWWELVGAVVPPPFRPAHLGMTFGSPSVVVAVQVLLVAAAAGGLGFATRGARIAVATLVVLTGVMAFISGSRSVWLALAGAVAIVAVLAVIAHGTRLRAGIGSTLKKPWGRAAAAAALVLAVIAAVLLGPALLERFASYGDGGRPDYWATAVRMLVDAPLLGQGPGTWMVRRVAYAEPGELDAYQPHAHDQYLQAGAELGLVGLAAGVIAFACVGWLLLRAIRGGDPRRTRWAWASVFGLVFLALDVVVDVHTIPTVALLMAIPIAALDATSDRPIGLPAALRTAADPLRRVALAALLIGCVVAIGVLARSESVALTNVRAVVAINDEEWAAALPPARDSAAAEPDVGTYQVALGLAALGTGDWETAEQAYRRAVAIDDLPASWLGLAVAQAELRQPADLVDASLQEALRLGEQQAAIRFAAAQVYDRVGMTETADATYVRTLAALPSLAADKGWRAMLGPERHARIVEGAIAAAPTAAWEIALMDGDPERARTLTAGSGWEILQGQVIAAWSGDTDALEAVQAAAGASPQDPTLLAWAARLSEHAGDLEAADRYRRLIRLGPHYAPESSDARITDGPDERDDNVGLSTYFYGTYTYRRASPIDILPPGPLGLETADAERPDEPDG